MPKKLTIKHLMKAYYNLLLLLEVKNSNFKTLFSQAKIPLELKQLAKEDLKEIGETVDFLKEMIDDLADSDPAAGRELFTCLNDDPYYKLVLALETDSDDLKETIKNIDKKLLN